MLSPANQVTTVVDAMPRVFLPAAQTAAALSYNLYFHIILKTNNKSLSSEDRRRLEKYIVGLVRTKGNVKAVGTTAKQLNLLIAVPQSCALGDFVSEVKLLSKNFVRRKLNGVNFEWREDYEAFTVSLSQISRVRANIWRQMQFEG
jgi:hypothetical protein